MAPLKSRAFTVRHTLTRTHIWHTYSHHQCTQITYMSKRKRPYNTTIKPPQAINILVLGILYSMVRVGLFGLKQLHIDRLSLCRTSPIVPTVFIYQPHRKLPTLRCLWIVQLKLLSMRRRMCVYICVPQRCAHQTPRGCSTYIKHNTV